MNSDSFFDPSTEIQAPNSLARAAFLLGFLSLILGFSTGIAGVLFGSLGLLLALLSRGSEPLCLRAKLGAISSVLGIFIGVSITIFAFSTFLKAPEVYYQAYFSSIGNSSQVDSSLPMDDSPQTI